MSSDNNMNTNTNPTLESTGGNAKEQFSSFFGFLMVCIGFVVGVGSLWRFPYVCGSNGGALFLVTYIIIIILICIPLLTAEMSIGFSTKKTPAAAYKQLAPGKKWYFAGYMHAATSLILNAYTITVYGTVLNYMFRTATGYFTGMEGKELSDYYNSFAGSFSQQALWCLLSLAIVALILRGGLQGGVEKLSKYMLPVLAVIMVVLIVLGLRLPGAGDGLAFLLKPDFSSFGMDAVQAALGQAFFAVGIGMLSSMVFGSYIGNPKQNLVPSSTIICGGIVVAGLMAGSMIFPMVFAYGLQPSEGSGLTFITLTSVFAQIPGGRIIGVLFYFGFFIAALTTMVGSLEGIIGFIRGIVDISRGKAMAITLILLILLAIPSALSQSVFHIFDFLVSNILLVVGAFIIAIFVGYVWGIDHFLEAINVKNKYVKVWLTVSVKFISPIAIAIIFITQMIG